MPLASFRVVDSPEEASLHPRAIWKHWKTYVLWDHRTYYGILEFIAALVMIFGVPGLTKRWQPLGTKLITLLRTGAGALLLLGVCPIHWYSNQRQSTHFLTRARTHLMILIFLIIVILVLLVVSQSLAVYGDTCTYDCSIASPSSMFLWMSIPILLIAATVVWTVTRNPPRDVALAELPSPTDSENYYRPAWSSANVADGIEDDLPELEGQVRLM